ncbi:MAG TPA: ABC transporter substrate-binding protein [bacterium]|nr:ABC transporter substrate-binding protein [bacterium]
MRNASEHMVKKDPRPLERAGRIAAALLLLAGTVAAAPELTVAYHLDDHAAPLFDACLYPKDFSARYGLFLRQAEPRLSYSLIDGKSNTLKLRLAYCGSDSAVLAALLSGRAQVGILASEDVLAAVIQGQPVRIIAPLQRASDVLVVNRSVPARNWKEFAAWAKAQNRPVLIGYLGQYSMAALGFAQALECDGIIYSTTLPGSTPHSSRQGFGVGELGTKDVQLIQADDRAELATELSYGRFDAALLQEPAATWVSSLRGCPAIGRTDILPPGRFEDRPGTVVAATESTIATRGDDVGRFLELMAVATHYANNHTRNTLAAVNLWLGLSPELESIPLRSMGFSSRPDFSFTDGIWNWYFALRLRNALPQNLAGYMEEKDWLGVPYDSLLLIPALDRAGARIIR